ncbi:MAG: hypothetical protein ACOCYU_05085 [Brevefilum sp.]
MAKKEIHQELAIELFNQTWALIDQEEKDPAEIDRMIHAAHASRYHWEEVGGSVNVARGEWLISRVYVLLNRTEPSLYHADRCLEITLENDLKDFDLAFAYEAMARAVDLAGDEVKRAKYITLAEEAGSKIGDPEDRQYFFSELATISPGSQE